MTTLLEVRDLQKSFGGVRAVDHASFTLGEGEFLALIGPNGAGKSTCFNILNGQLAADGGEILLAGESILGLGPRQIWRRGVGRTFQVAAIWGSLTVCENVQMALLSHAGEVFRFWRAARERYRDQALALLGDVGMQAQAHRPARELAYGDVKRVELAIALANEPKLLLMDEPTAGMAPRERAALMELTRRIARERRIGVLFTEHDMLAVFAHADRILVLVRGEIVAAGTPEEVRANPRVREVYLGEAGAAAAARARKAGP
jgi:branched-chain amino acid transport system ATP-binding protein